MSQGKRRRGPVPERRRDFQVGALIGFAMVALFAPLFIAAVPAPLTADAWYLSGLMTAALIVVYLFGDWSPAWTFVGCILPALGVSVLVNLMTGAAASRFSFLFIAVILFAVYYCGPWYGVAAGVVSVGSNVAVVIARHPMGPQAFELMYLHVGIIVMILLLASWIAWRQDFLRARLTALTNISFSLHRGDAPEDVVNVVAEEASSVLDARGVLVREVGPGEPTVLARVGAATSGDLGDDPANLSVRSQVADRTYEVTLVHPRHRDMEALASLHNQITLALERAHGRQETVRELETLLVDVRRAHLATLEVMADMLERRDPHTSGHSRRVAVLATAAAEALGASQETVRVVRGAAILHDMGKIVLPDSILKKAGPLTPEEWDEVKLHPEVGSALVGHAQGLTDFLPAIRCHHERWDGKGYPDALRRDEIPEAARIIAAADAFDAMTSPRVYRQEVRSAMEAAGVLIQLAGSQWDPRVARAVASIATDPRLPDLLAGASALRLEGLAANGDPLIS